jgi:hypothetical protein
VDSVYREISQRGLRTIGELARAVDGRDSLTWMTLFDNSLTGSYEPPVCVYQQRLMVIPPVTFLVKLQKRRASSVGWEMPGSSPWGIPTENLMPEGVELLTGWDEMAAAIRRCVDDMPSGRIWCWCPVRKQPKDMRVLVQGTEVIFALPGHVAGHIQHAWGTEHQARVTSKVPT